MLWYITTELPIWNKGRGQAPALVLFVCNRFATCCFFAQTGSTLSPAYSIGAKGICACTLSSRTDTLVTVLGRCVSCTSEP